MLTHRLKLAVFTFLIVFSSAVVAVNAQFVGAVEPAGAVPSPASPGEQQKRFLLPPGFEIELFASEEQGAGKPITVAWDDSGRLWTITALEYPLDGNEQPELAKALYEKGGRDKVLVFDTPYASGPQKPRVFADGLAMPMGILPYKDGALVGQGPDLYWMHDTDGDGRADKRETILTGFGIQDSHLMPHQFTRAPGGWFYLAQGAFNYSKVKTRDGREHPFNQTRLARFTVDGMKFEDVTCGPCNIWGLVIGREGEAFIQEANDYGYPVMAYHAGASYPGCSGAFKAYAPYFPSEVDFRMGGTGLSGLALSDPTGSFPGDYADVMYVANPITRKIQAIKIHRNGPWYRYEKLPDFINCADEWFRPVAIHFGPDGCLYIVDWYNKIISHNEVPRTHPERDKTRGRIWRVRHASQRNSVPNIANASDSELLKFLGSEATWEIRAAWHQIVDRGLVSLAPDLKTIVENGNASVTHRIHAFWALEDLKQLEMKTIRALSIDLNRNIRREAIRALATVSPPASEALPFLNQLRDDVDPEVRAEVLRVAGRYAQSNSEAVSLLASMVKPALDQPIGKSPQSGAPMKLREAYDREFERYLVRSMLENLPERAAAFLKSEAAEKVSVDTRLLIALALPKDANPNEVPRLLAQLDRIPSDEELLRLVENVESPDSKAALRHLLLKENTRRPVLEALLKVRNRIDPSKLQNEIAGPLQTIWDRQPGEREFVARIGGAFKVESLAEVFLKALKDDNTPSALRAALLRSLRELNAGDPEVFAKLLANPRDQELRNEALTSLASSKNPAATRWILEYWPEFNALQRRTALRQLTVDAGRAGALVSATRTGTVQERDLDAESIDSILKHLPDDPDARALVERISSQFKPVLQLDGRKESFVDSNITLEGPFTVETWVRLEEGISNSDGILGYPGGADFNFAGGTFRVYCGPEFGDRVVARRPMTPNTWTHLAVSRDSKGVFRLFNNGEIDSTDNRAVTATLPDLDIGRTTPNSGTAGELTEFRVWNLARSAEEIRADFDRTFQGEPKPSGLVHYFPGSGPWGTLKGGAQVKKITDAPPLLSAEEARALATKFAKFRGLAEQEGNSEKGKALFATVCAVCHSVGGQGGQIGPVLNGAAANGIESLLRSVLTPNAAIEGGYRTFRIELKDGDVLDGFLVSQNNETILLRQPNVEDQRIEKAKVRRADFIQRSVMPEGLLDTMPDQDVRDLIAYLKTLK